MRLLVSGAVVKASKFGVASIESEMAASAAKSLTRRRALTLQWLAANAGESAVELAQKLRVHKQTVYQYFWGKRGVPDTVEEIVCSHYQISIEELRSGKPIERIRHDQA